MIRERERGGERVIPWVGAAPPRATHYTFTFTAHNMF